MKHDTVTEPKTVIRQKKPQQATAAWGSKRDCKFSSLQQQGSLSPTRGWSGGSPYEILKERTKSAVDDGF